jgi:hypothetical protein
VSILLDVTHDEHQINFRDNINSVNGYTTFTKEVWEKIKDLKWYVNDEKLKKGEKTYIYTGSGKFGNYKKLHQIIMLIWYGEKELKEAYEKNFIVEHHDNNAFNCLIENLSFASNDINLAKAHLYDKERPMLINEVAVNFFKDFKTRKYQITLGFNQPYTLFEDSKETSLMKMYLVYNDNFRLVITDATRIVSDLLESESFDLSLLRPVKWEYEPAIFVYANEGQELPSFTYIDGKVVMVLSDNPKRFVRIDKVSPNQSLYEETD